MALNRRQLIIASAAAALAATMPVASPTADIVAQALPAEPLPPPRRGWWGYSTNDGEWFNGPFASREDALAQAQSDYPEFATTTAWCVPELMRTPHLSEHCIEWMNDDRQLTAGHVRWWFEGANEDIDYEGEVTDALQSADFSGLIADLRDACATALFRAGRPDLIPAILDPGAQMPISEDDQLLDRLANDKEFDRDCDEAGERWLTAQKLHDAPRMLTTEKDQHHDALEPEAA